jgi:hypothetical protein
MITELDETRFRATIVQPVRQIADKNRPEVGLDAYLIECNAKSNLLTERSDFVLMQVYASGDNRHVHVTLWYGIPDRALVVVIDRPRRTILGHHFLKVDNEGGAAGVPWPINTPRPPVLSSSRRLKPEE